jgi:hypothetical protein
MRAAAREQRTPLWSDDTGAVVSRLVAPIGAGEGNARYYAAGLWPANLPLLQHRSVISLPEGGRDLTGGILRLRVVAGEAGDAL